MTRWGEYPLCPHCGQKIINPGGHAEACYGPGPQLELAPNHEIDPSTQVTRTQAAPDLTRSDLTAVAIALDELLSYHDAVGNVDDDEYREYEKHAWTIRKLQSLLERHRFEVAP